MSTIRFVRLLSVLALTFATSALSASTTYEVGTCMPGLPSFPTISAAVAAVPSGGVVKVCPGTYNEQVVITQPVTLEGVSNGDSAQAIIAVPSGGLVANALSPIGDVAAQLWVDNVSGLVNISDLTVDGSGNGVPRTFVVGIFYQNSGGTVNRVATRNQSNNKLGIGIWAEAGPSNPSVTIENASVHDFDFTGILAENVSPSPDATSFTAVIKSNEVTTTAASNSGIAIALASGGSFTVTNNLLVSPGSIGITTSLIGDGFILGTVATGSISGNTVVNAGTFGIVDQTDGVSVTSNKIFGGPTGIALASSVATIQSNTITKSTTGIDFKCNADPNVHSNIIMDTGTALSSVASAIGPSDTYFNVGTIRTGGC